jgi:hypothetical protein
MDHLLRRSHRLNKVIQGKMVSLESTVWPKVTAILDRLDQLASDRPHVSEEDLNIKTVALRIETAILRHTVENEVKKIRALKKEYEKEIDELI